MEKNCEYKKDKTNIATKNIYCVKLISKENSQILFYISDKTSVLYIVWNKCGNNNNKIYNKEKVSKCLKLLVTNLLN